MKTSIMIARLMGPVLLAMGLGMALGLGLEGDGYAGMVHEFVASKPLIFLSGVLVLVAGLAIVNAHNVWEPDWRAIITVLGWLGIVRGIASLLFPVQVQSVGERMVGSHTGLIIGAAITVALGAVLSFMGYEDLWAEHRRPRRAAASTGSRSSAKRPRRR
jgi:predicted lysophospholipase L1 biosynthesis ABC-type transport system permease subunit